MAGGLAGPQGASGVLCLIALLSLAAYKEPAFAASSRMESSCKWRASDPMRWSICLRCLLPGPQHCSYHALWPLFCCVLMGRMCIETKPISSLLWECDFSKTHWTLLYAAHITTHISEHTALHTILHTKTLQVSQKQCLPKPLDVMWIATGGRWYGDRQGRLR